MAALLDWWETIKKDEHGNNFHDKWKRFSTFCYFCPWHAREGSPGRTIAIESNHGSKNGRTHFERAGMDKRSNRYRICEIVLTYDPRISTPHYPVGQGAGMGPGIGYQVGTLNHVLS